MKWLYLSLALLIGAALLSPSQVAPATPPRMTDTPEPPLELPYVTPDPTDIPPYPAPAQIQAAAPRCTITSAQLTITPDAAEAGAIVTATAHITVASPCVFRPVLRVPGALTVYQYADASSLGDAVVDWPVTATAAGVYRLELLIDGVLYDSATLTVGEPPPLAVQVWLPLIARGTAPETHAVWLPVVGRAPYIMSPP